MTNTIILDNFLPGNLAEQCLNAITDLQSTHPQDWSRYDNPWEHKTILNKKLPPMLWSDPSPSPIYDIREAVIATCLERMRRGHVYFENCLQPVDPFEFVIDASYHYDGVFIYGPGDRLDMHLDAGIHPTNGLRKHATAVLYLTNSHAPFVMQQETPLPVWSHGVQSTSNTIIDPVANRLVCFVNDDQSWHGAPGPVWGNEQRVVLTVSFMSSAVDLYSNKCTRAYFADTGDPATDRLRDRRAIDGYSVAVPVKELP